MISKVLKPLSLAMAVIMLMLAVSCGPDDPDVSASNSSSTVSVDPRLDLSDAPSTDSYKNPYLDDHDLSPLLLYTGYKGTAKYPDFTDEDLQQLADAGVKDYLVISGACPNYYYEIDDSGNNIGELQQILSDETIEKETAQRLNKNGTFDTASLIVEYKKRMKDYNKDETVTLNQCIQYEIDLFKRIVETSPDARIWISFPFINDAPFAEYYARPFVHVAYKLVKAKLTEEEFNKNFAGMYWASEDTGFWDTTFDKTNFTDFDNPLCKAANYCTAFLHADGKTHIWIPYTTLDDQITCIGYIANRTNIFDAVFMQAGYFWHEENKDMIDLLQRSTKANAVLNDDGVVYGGEKTSDTLVGAEIEIDQNISLSKGEEYFARYKAYYDALIQYKDTSPIAIYAEDRRGLMYETVFDNVADWYE